MAAMVDNTPDATAAALNMCANCARKLTDDMLLYCQSCQMVVCGLCCYRQHHDKSRHEVQEIAVTLDEKGSDLMEKLRKASEKHAKLKTVVSELKQLEQTTTAAIAEHFRENETTKELAALETLLTPKLKSFPSFTDAYAKFSHTNDHLSNCYNRTVELLDTAKAGIEKLYVSLTDMRQKTSDVFIVIGGDDGTDTLTSAEVHPIANLSKLAPKGSNRVQMERPVFFRTPPIPEPRIGATAHIVGERLYVIGGSDRTGFRKPTDTLWVYNLERQQRRWIMGPAMKQPRCDAAGGVIGDRIYICGGRSDYDSVSCECFDTTTFSWLPMPPMNAKRFHATAAVSNGQLYVIGGLTSSGYESARNPSRVIERYDPRLGKWSFVASMANASWMCHSAISIGPWIYVCGGYNASTSCEKYCPTDNEWTPIARMNIPRQDFTLVATKWGQLLAVGGREADNLDGIKPLASIECYDPVRNRWTLIDDALEIPRFGHASVALKL